MVGVAGAAVVAVSVGELASAVAVVVAPVPRGDLFGVVSPGGEGEDAGEDRADGDRAADPGEQQPAAAASALRGRGAGRATVPSAAGERGGLRLNGRGREHGLCTRVDPSRDRDAVRERGGEGAGGGPAGGGVLGERTPQGGGDRLGDAGVDGRHIGRVLVHDLEHEAGALALEGRAAGQHLVGDDGEGVDVGGGGEVLAAHLLRGHVAWRAHGEAGHGEAGGVEGAGDAEVGEGGATAGVDDDVAGLDVAVDHALSVGVVEGAGELGDDAAGLGWGEGSALGDDAVEALAFEEAHGDVAAAVGGGADVVDGDDVGMVEASGEACFLVEALAEVGVVGVGGGDGLEGDLALEDAVEGAVDGCGRAASELRLDGVAIGDQFGRGHRRLTTIARPLGRRVPACAAGGQDVPLPRLGGRLGVTI